MARYRTSERLTSLQMAQIELEATVGRSSILRAYHPDPKKRTVGLHTYVRIAKAAEKLGLPLPPEQNTEAA